MVSLQSEKKPAPHTGARLGVIIGGTRYTERDSDEAKFCLDLFDLERGADTPERIRLDFLAHGFAVHPKRPHEAALLEKKGPGGCYVDLVSRRVLSPILPLSG